MYDNGDQGSNVSIFNNVTIPAYSAYPTGGAQYVETCSLSEVGGFLLYFNDPDQNDDLVGEISLTTQSSGGGYWGNNYAKVWEQDGGLWVTLNDWVEPI
jgi:hypothetical protein